MKFDWYRLIKPRAWIQVGKTNWEWDEILNSLLDKHEVANIDYYTCDIGGATVWAANFPYGYGNLYRLGESQIEKQLPTVRTRYRLHRLIVEQQNAIMKAKIDKQFEAMRNLK